VVNREETLEFAHELIAWGVPVIVCKPTAKGDEVVPVVSWRNITNAAQCKPMLEQYEHGTDALALIGGYGIDVIDVDSKAGGTIAPFGDFQHYGVTRTPSGGTHYVITSTGLRRKQNLEIDGQWVGDYIGGTAGHESRMLAFLPGSHRPKYGDTQYEFEVPWDIEGAVLGEPDEKVKYLLEKAIADEPERDTYVDESPRRDPSLGVHPYAAKAIDAELQRLKDLPHPWEPGSYWDNTTFEVACQLIRFANSGWTGYGLDDALADLLAYAPSDEAWGEREHKQKWRTAREAVGDGGRKNPDSADNDFDVVDGDAPSVRLEVDVRNPDDAYKWLVRFLGRPGTPLAGLFRRGIDDLVHTPRVGEDGYIEPHEESWSDGPAQVRRMTTTSLTACLANNVRVYKTTATGETPALYPPAAAALAADSPEYLQEVRPLRGVTHTPMLRGDGSILSRPGYDDETAMLYMPPAGFTLPEEHEGLALLEEMVCDFPFQTPHHKANYFAALLTPLLRLLAPPPYPLYAFGAPQPGSGKSLLADLIRAIHGGVFRSEMVRDAAELRKQITAILDTTAAPVVTFDNLNGVLRSSVLDGLLTSAEWSDRILGLGQDRTLPNDRLWTITGNNLSLGGDLRRRTVWVTIDPRMEHPEERSDFRHPDLERWVVSNRPRLLAALLGLVSDWVTAGGPLQEPRRSDSYALWEQTVDSVLVHAGCDGTVNHVESVRKEGLEDEDEWGNTLAGLWRVYGGEPFLVKQVLNGVGMGEGLEEDELPGDIADRVRKGLNASKTFGWWLKNRADRWAGGRAVVAAGKDGKTGVAKWRVVTQETDLL
jgi:hypothetical protein